MTTTLYSSDAKIIATMPITSKTIACAKAHAEDYAQRHGVDFAYFTITDDTKRTSRHFTREGKRTDDVIKMINARATKA